MRDATVHGCADCPLNVASCPFSARKVPGGASLVEQGEPGLVMFVKQGMVSATTLIDDGDERVVSVRGPRSLLGLEALAGQPAASSVHALTPVDACAASASTVSQWLGPTSAARTMVGLLLKELTRERDEWELRQGRALVRVARFALAWADLAGTGRLVPLPKQRVARVLGMRAETFSRCLRRLEAKGALDAKVGIKVLDAELLADIASPEWAAAHPAAR